MKEYPLVFIIIVNWNGKEILRKCLTSIKEHTDYLNYKVLVVDNGSIDSSVEMIRREFGWADLIENNANLGFAKANNIGIEYALRWGAECILLLNNDIEVCQRDWLSNMIEAAELDGKIGIVGCKLLYPNGRIQHAGARISVRGLSHYGVGEADGGQYDELREVDYVTGAALMIKRETLDKIGLLDEEFSPAYFEEVDWCVRARKLGYKVMYNPKTTLVHHEGVSKRKCREDYLYFISRKNFVRFMFLHFPFSWVILRLPHEARMLPLKSAKKLRLFLKAYLVNLGSIREILRLRRKGRKASIKVSCKEEL